MKLTCFTDYRHIISRSCSTRKSTKMYIMIADLSDKSYHLIFFMYGAALLSEIHQHMVYFTSNCMISNFQTERERFSSGAFICGNFVKSIYISFSLLPNGPITCERYILSDNPESFTQLDYFLLDRKNNCNNDQNKITTFGDAPDPLLL